MENETYALISGNTIFRAYIRSYEDAMKEAEAIFNQGLDCGDGVLTLVRHMPSNPQLQLNDRTFLKNYFKRWNVEPDYGYGHGEDIPEL